MDIDEGCTSIIETQVEPIIGYLESHSIGRIHLLKEIGNGG